MECNTIGINGYPFSASDTLFIDANVFLYVYGPNKPTIPDNRTKSYSGALARIIGAKCEVYIDVLIISEFINRWARLEYDIQKKCGISKYKDYRGSDDFIAVTEAIAAGIRQILKYSQIVGSGLENVDINTILADFEDKKTDFNDRVIVELCRTNDYILITHDVDFMDYDITVLSCNQKLLT